MIPSFNLSEPNFRHPKDPEDKNENISLNNQPSYDLSEINSITSIQTDSILGDLHNIDSIEGDRHEKSHYPGEKVFQKLQSLLTTGENKQKAKTSFEFRPERVANDEESTIGLYGNNTRKRVTRTKTKQGSSSDTSESSEDPYNMNFKSEYDEKADASKFDIDVPPRIQKKLEKPAMGVSSTLMLIYHALRSKRILHSEKGEKEKQVKQKPERSPTNNNDTDPNHIKLPQFSLPDTGDTSDTRIGHNKDSNTSKIKLKFGRNHHRNQTPDENARITVHIADIPQREKFILTLCEAFMKCGAPTHRLEEYMSLTSLVLEIDSSFVYLPGCMIVSFGDSAMKTSEVHLVRCAEGLNLGKLDEVHCVYRDVVYDQQGVTEAAAELRNILNKKPTFNPWICIIMYAFSSGMVAPWAYGGSWKDIPICICVGAVIGFLEYIICPKSTLYSSLFEVTASIISSFMARAIGSVHGGKMFCYSAIVQSSLALILPGYIILCGSLELQSRNLVAGSVRMFYAFIYSLMLSFGISLGAALYGWIDEGATSATTCTSDVNSWWRFLFVPAFTCGIALTNQAVWKQLPIMVIISGAGYAASYFAGKHFKNETEITAALGCFVISLTSNAYSRFSKIMGRGFDRYSFMTASLMLPGIFVQVPSGIAGQGSVILGISTANNLVHSNNSSNRNPDLGTYSVGTLSFGMVMINVTLGISVGLYLATIVSYPFGKARSALFSL